MESTQLTGKEIQEFYRLAREDIKALLKDAAVGSAVVFNHSDSPVTFYVYNYIDTVYLVSAQRTRVAPKKYGAVVASGSHFKIHPDDNKNHEFMVSPGKAYVYNGPGDVDAL